MPPRATEPRARRRRNRLVLTAATAAIVITAGIGWSQLGAGADPPPPSIAPMHLAPSSELLTNALLRQQAIALMSRRRADYLTGWAQNPAAQALAATTYDNLARLGIAAFTSRIDEGTVSGTGSSWTAGVDVAWRLRDDGPGTVTSRLTYGFEERDGQVAVTSIEVQRSAPEPIWLLASLQIRRGPHVMAAGTDPAQTTGVAGLLRRAAAALHGVLPGWRGRLVAYVPGSAGEFDALVDAEPGAYSGIAAVTTTVDGTGGPRAPEVLVVNPTVFGGLSRVGAQVVATHEATHVATRAAASSMPVWLVEGFADYVAIRAAHAPVRVSARAAIQQVRRQGAPTSLPADAAFSVDGDRLEATYEQAWLATSLIATRDGQARLVAFYRWVQAHPMAEATGFRTVLHTSRAAFTSAWRARLQALAGPSGGP